MKKIRNEEGVSSVIGALMAVIIFTTSITIFVTYYVPNWMEDNEAHHMKEVSNGFSNLKATIDTQILRAETSNETLNSISIYTPISLGNKGIPIFAGETSGSLAVNSYQNSFTIYNNSKTFVSAKGNIKFSSQNRYFIQQDYIYENGAIIIMQENKEFIKVPPNFELENKSNGISLSILMIYLIGEKSGITGTNVEEISTKLSVYRKESYKFNRKGLMLNITTLYSSAWQEFLNNTFENVGLVYNRDYTYNYPSQNTIILTINNVTNLNVQFAGIKTKMAVGWNS